MSRHNGAPTHGWVIGSQITKWLATIFVLLILFLVISSWAIFYSINRDCHNLYTRNIQVPSWWPLAGHHWLHIEAGSTDLGCPQP